MRSPVRIDGRSALTITGLLAALGCSQPKANPGSEQPLPDSAGSPRSAPAAASQDSSSKGVFSGSTTVRPSVFSHFVGESQQGDTNWIAAIRYGGGKATVEFGYTLGRNSTSRIAPQTVLDSVAVDMVDNEMPYANCGEKGRRHWREILAFVNRGPDDPVARLAWLPSPQVGKLIPVPADSVHCEPESSGD